MHLAQTFNLPVRYTRIRGQNFPHPPLPVSEAVSPRKLAYQAAALALAHRMCEPVQSSTDIRPPPPSARTHVKGLGTVRRRLILLFTTFFVCVIDRRIIVGTPNDLKREYRRAPIFTAAATAPTPFRIARAECPWSNGAFRAAAAPRKDAIDIEYKA